MITKKQIQKFNYSGCPNEDLLTVSCGCVDTTPSNPSTPNMPDMPLDGKNWVLDVTPELPLWQSQPMTASESGLSSGTQRLESSEKAIAGILPATPVTACELEGTSWTGTVEGNIEKYHSIQQDP